LNDHDGKIAALQAELSRGPAGEVGLDKATSNLFRDRHKQRRPGVNLRHFNEVISVNPQQGWADAEGTTTYAELVTACLQQGVMPAVVPELQSITIGGAATGVGIESTSFRHGLVHHNLQEIDILTAGQEFVHCTPHNKHSDLFFGFPNSYGTLGYALRLRTRTLPVKPYVHLRHIRFDNAGDYFRSLEEHCRGDADFVDGTVFSRNELYITLGHFTDQAPFVSDYTYKNIYYRSLQERDEDYLTIHGYIWRWDTDWFWCSKNVFAQRPLIRRLYGRKRLNSVTYTRIMRWNSRWGLTRFINRLRGIHAESVIQDVDIPIDRASEFLDFLLREIGILPVWICPIGTRGLPGPFPLYPLRDNTLYINFGFWDVVHDRQPRPDGYYNHMIEKKVSELGGIKSLYSSSYYEEPEFWSIYNQGEYWRLKQRYDPDNRFPDLFRKCVLRRH